MCPLSLCLGAADPRLALTWMLLGTPFRRLGVSKTPWIACHKSFELCLSCRRHQLKFPFLQDTSHVHFKAIKNHASRSLLTYTNSTVDLSLASYATALRHIQGRLTSGLTSV